MTRASEIRALATVLMVSGCHSVAMRVPPELAPAERLPVAGRSGWNAGRRIGFGEYSAERSVSGFRSFVTRLVADIAKADAIEPMSFDLRPAGQEPWRAECDPVLAAEGPSTPEESPLRCAFSLVAGDSTPPWRLAVLKTPIVAPPRGDLVGPSELIEVLGTMEDEEGQVLMGDRPVAYVLRAQGRVLAAVEVVGDGAVWFHPDLSPERRDLLAVAAAALLFWDYLVY